MLFSSAYCWIIFLVFNRRVVPLIIVSGKLNIAIYNFRVSVNFEIIISSLLIVIPILYYIGE